MTKTCHNKRLRKKIKELNGKFTIEQLDDILSSDKRCNMNQSRIVGLVRDKRIEVIEGQKYYFLEGS